MQDSSSNGNEMGEQLMSRQTVVSSSFEPKPNHMTITDEHTACFEAGIKFGSLYHQFAGTPVSPRSATALSRAMESAIENQPYCTDVSIAMDTAAIAEDAIHGYTELTGRYFEVELTVEYADIILTASMQQDENDYPRMKITTIESSDE